MKPFKPRENSSSDTPWNFTLRKPKSERFVQVSFKGFGSHGKNKFDRAFNTLRLFIKSIFKYTIRKIKSVFVFGGKSVVWMNFMARGSKRFLVQKLIWSRGKLGRPIANFVVISIAFLVFMFGSVFNSSKFVNSQELNPDYLQNVTDIIPQRNVATTLIPEDRKRTEPFAYTVVSGDTLSGIGSKFKISTDALKYVNSLTDNSVLKVGQNLTIPPISGLIHEVADGDSIQSIADKYDVAPQAIADFNYILDTSSLAVGTELVIPDAKVPQPVIIPSIPASFDLPSFTAPPPSGDWCIWPTSTRIITQYFSWYHNGVDIATPWGSLPPLYACSGGVVTRSGWDPWGLGLHVEIDHGNGYTTVYGHMSRVDVGYGQGVSRGEVIGVMGNTGRSTGPHVHFIIKYNGVPQNPFDYIR